MSRSGKRSRRKARGQRTRTQMIRDEALATGRTCIACGDEAVTRVGDYPVCERHRSTVRAPDRDQNWKKNVRGRHARVPMRACARCGNTRNLTRHHDWAGAEPGRPPKVVVLCRECHVALEMELADD